MLKARIKQFHDVIKNQAIDLTREPMKFVEPEALIAETHHDTKDSIDLNREPLRFAEPEALLAEIKPDSDEALMLEKEAAEAMLDYLKEMESSVDTDTESDESLSSLEDDDEAHADDVEDELPADKRFFALCREYLGGVTLSTNKLYQEFKALPDNAKENFLDAFENELARSKKQTSIPPVRAKTPKPVFDQEAAIKQAEIKIKTLVTDITMLIANKRQRKQSRNIKRRFGPEFKRAQPLHGKLQKQQQRLRGVQLNLLQVLRGVVSRL
jgi:hypothetical protein